MKVFLLSMVIVAVVGLLAVRLLSARLSKQAQLSNTETSLRASLVAISVTLMIGSNRSLFILLAEDGSINRMGDGTIDCQARDLFVGRIEPNVFERVRSQLPETVLQYRGAYTMGKSLGAECELKLVFQFSDGSAHECQFFYGSESAGPPADIAALVRIAAYSTESWYQTFIRSAKAKS